MARVLVGVKRVIDYAVKVCLLYSLKFRVKVRIIFCSFYRFELKPIKLELLPMVSNIL